MKTLFKFFPAGVKQHAKSHMLKALTAEPEIVSRIATRVVRVGVVNYLNWDYPAEKARVLNYLEQRRAGTFEYTFSASSTKSTLYSSIYACMLLGLHGELETMPASVQRRWLDYFDGFQSESDGLFRDPALAGEQYETGGAWGDGWGIRHLLALIIIAYARLGGVPRYYFKFLEPYYNEGFLNEWLGRFDFSKDVWSSSNYIMNLYSSLQFARDYMGEKRAAKAIDQIAAWLLKRQSPETGMWHNYQISGYPLLGDAIRGAYHFYPLFEYEDKPVPNREKVIDHILRSQNSWGGFEAEKRPSGACEDIDALDPLIRFVSQTGHCKEKAELASKRALVWLLASQNTDGGYESLMENGCHLGNHPETSSAPGQSNMFATWFRTLTLAYLTEYLRLKNNYNIGTFPGYEIQLNTVIT